MGFDQRSQGFTWMAFRNAAVSFEIGLDWRNERGFLNILSIISLRAAIWVGNKLEPFLTHSFTNCDSSPRAFGAHE